MRFEIEFFRRSEEDGADEIVRRNSGQFSSESDAEIYGLKARPEDANGFRISMGGTLRKTVLVQPKPR